MSERQNLIDLRNRLIDSFVFSFGADKEYYSPGENIHISARLFEDNNPITNAQVNSSLEWRQGILGLTESPEESLNIQLEQPPDEPGVYLGDILAPEYMGIYDLKGTIAVPGKPILYFEKFLFIESTDL